MIGLIGCQTRADLELELNAGLAPARAFAIARRELGEPAALSKEFARAGRPRWRRWLVAGWAMYAASAALPVPPRVLWVGVTYGHEIFRDLILNIEEPWTWGASYICVANALRLRARQWAPARLRGKAARWLPGRHLEPR